MPATIPTCSVMNEKMCKTHASRAVKGVKKHGIVSQKKQVEKEKEKKDTYIGGGPNNQTNTFAKIFTKSLANVLQQKSKMIPTITSTTKNNTINDAATAFINNLVQSVDDSFKKQKKYLQENPISRNLPHMNAPHMNVPPMNAPPMNAPPMNVPPMNASLSSINNASYMDSNRAISLNDISPSFDDSTTIPNSTTIPDSKIATDIANALMMALKTTNELIVIRAGFINFNADLQLTSMNYFYYDNNKNLQIAQIR
jgi:hypothetical protein